jgi:hypothetical protein
MVWAGGWMLNVPAAEAIAQFRAGLFYSTLRDVVITAAPLAEGGEAEIRVSFTVPWSLAPYPQAQWDTMQAHDSWVPYTVPVIFTPVIELGFVERQGVSGRVELGGSVQRERLLIDGVESQSYLLHRAGRYEMLFRWKNHLYTSLDYGRHAKGECFDIALLNTERLRVQQMASDRRFVEPVRVALSSIRFTPNRRLFWGRERLSLPRNAEPSTALGSAEAPFSPFDLALARFKQQDVAGVPECGPSQRLDACLASGEKCEQSDPRPALAAARAGLQAIKPW